MQTKRKQRIAGSFQKWLLLLVLIAFLITTVFLWVTQTQLAENNAIKILSLNIMDVIEDINDASDKNLASLAKTITAELDAAPEITNDLLIDKAMEYDVTEINYVDKDGIIRATTFPDFLGYDMASGKQSAEFLLLLSERFVYTQDYGPVSYDASILRKYGGARLKRGGFIQIGYDSARFQRDISQNVAGITQNRHVGEGGCLIIIDDENKIVSDRLGNEGKSLNTTGIELDKSSIKPNTAFTADVYGEKSYCMYSETEGYLIVAVMPMSEAALSRNVSVGVTTCMEIVVFAALFIMIFFLVKKLVVNNIHRINKSLSEITEGNLETVVNVRSHEEFDELSNDINSTVDTLKKYIADAAARIDTELAFAKAIQHSSLPSVFPPYPNRKELDIYATMYTAKEVGGDFYDFYFVDEDNLAFLIADVSGKGIPAAMFMMQSKTIIKSCAETGMSVEEIFIHANEKLCEGNDAGMFVTAWMGILNVKTGSVFFANAGHNPPLVKYADGTYEYLKTRAGFVLAGMEGIRYKKNEIQLAPGDTIYLYTDGVTEATDINEQLYGEERLSIILEKYKNADVKTVCDEVKKDVDVFVGEAPQFDDITMLALRYNGTEGEK